RALGVRPGTRDARFPLSCSGGRRRAAGRPDRLAPLGRSPGVRSRDDRGRELWSLTMPSVLLPTPLRPYAGGAARVDVTGATVGEALERLVAAHAGLRTHLFDDAGKLRSFVNVYKNDEDVRYLEKDRTPIAPGDALSIVPSIAGGSAAAPPDLASLS